MSVDTIRYNGLGMMRGLIKRAQKIRATVNIKIYAQEHTNLRLDSRPCYFLCTRINVYLLGFVTRDDMDRFYSLIPV